MKAKTYFIDWIGCKVNNYESCAFEKIFTDLGLKKDVVNPDIVLVNTCSVTSVSDKKSRQIIHRHRKQFPNAILCAMGCFCQSANQETIGKLTADVIIGTNNRKKLIDDITQYEKDHRKVIDINYNHRKFKYDDYPLVSLSELTRAYVKIQDGCNKFCSYCIIPYTRGASRSRFPEKVVDEINLLINKGYKEIVLTGIDVASYGLDLSPKTTFSSLLETILVSCPKLYRLRISSIEESMIDDKFINLLRKYPKIANQMHLSLQSGSDVILKKMNRKYTCDQFYKKVEKIRSVRPDMNLTTDIIVGFPGETEEDFLDTCEFIIKCGMSHIHVFPYSARNGTVAASMPNQILPREKKNRVNTLISISNEQEDAYAKKFDNKKTEFIIEHIDKENKLFYGRSSEFLLCEFPLPKKEIHEGDIITETIKFDNVKIV